MYQQFQGQGIPQMQQPGGMMLQQGGQPIVYAPVNQLHMMYGYDKLNVMPGIYVKQKFQLLEVVSGCELQQKFAVYPADQGGEKSEPEIFYCKEKSGWCARNCLHADCRPFKMDVTHYAKDNASLDGKLFLRFERDFFCTVCCINRPNMRVYYTEQGKDEYIGRIHSPCLLCSLGLDVENQTNDLLYKISGSCCQLGVWCKWPCEACQTIDFSIFDKQDQRVATLQKRTAGCVKSMVSDTSNFSLKFPEQSDKIARALLLASVIFMDYRYFQERPGDKKNQGGLMG